MGHGIAPGDDVGISGRLRFYNSHSLAMKRTMWAIYAPAPLLSDSAERAQPNGPKYNSVA